MQYVRPSVTRPAEIPRVATDELHHSTTPKSAALPPVDTRRFTASPGEDSTNIDRLFAAALRQRWILLGSMMLALALGALYLQLVTPRYSASASILMVGQVQAGTEGNAVRGAPTIDPVRVDTQVEVIRSDQTIRNVPAQLGPDARAALLLDAGPARRDGAMPLDHDTAGPEQRNSEKLQRELEALRRNLRVSRLDRTYVLVVTYTSVTQGLAAIVANAIAEEYLRRQVQDLLDRGAVVREHLQSRAAQLAKEIATVEAESLKVFRDGRATGEAIERKRELELNGEVLRHELESINELLPQVSRLATASTSDARISVRATTPASPTQPRAAMVLVVAVVLGLVIGGSGAAARELSDRSLRTAATIEEVLQTPCLGVVPSVPPALCGAMDTTLGFVGPEGIKPVPASLLSGYNFPLSRHAEALRAAYVAAKIQSEGAVVIGVTSVLPGEGKTSFAANMGFLLAAEGVAVLLVDADTRSMDLTTQLAPSTAAGLLDLADGRQQCNILSHVLTEQKTGLAFLPAGALAARGKPPGLSVAGLRALLATARTQYDLVLIDMLPAGITADAKVCIAELPSFVLVARWGHTRQTAISRYLEAQPRLRQRLLGVVMSEVDLRRLGTYESSGEAKTSSYNSFFDEPPRSGRHLPEVKSVH